ncbi:hypothetical protein EZMO1_1891 [Endozoicomonas montiporae CL-33]|nr:hypothetical protein EZMO1_1891 [Endozoicomonas montiporae CL-33]
MDFAGLAGTLTDQTTPFESWKPSGIVPKRSFLGHAVDAVTNGCNRLLQQLDHYLPATKALETAFSITPVIGPVSRMLLQENQQASELSALEHSNYEIVCEAGSLIKNREYAKAIHDVRNQASRINTLASAHESNALSDTSYSSSILSTGIPLLGTLTIGAPLSLLASAVSYAVNCISDDRTKASEASAAKQERQMSLRLAEQAQKWEEEEQLRIERESTNRRTTAVRQNLEKTIRQLEYKLETAQLGCKGLVEEYTRLKKSNTERSMQTDRKQFRLNQKLEKATKDLQLAKIQSYESQEELTQALESRKRYQDIQEGRIIRLSKTKAELVRTLTTKEATLTELSAQFEGLQCRCRSFIGQLQFLENELKLQESERLRLQEANRVMEQKLESSQNNVSVILENLRQRNQQIESLEQDIESIALEKESLEQDIENITLEKESLENTFEENSAKLAEQRNSQSAQTEEIEHLSTLLKEAENQIISLKQQLQAADDLLFEFQLTE